MLNTTIAPCESAVVAALSPTDNEGKANPSFDPAFVAWAICAVFANQTQDERAMGATRQSNGVGFSKFDASSGAYFARWALGLPRHAGDNQLQDALISYLCGEPLIPSRPLTGAYLIKASKMAIKYRKQVIEALSHYVAPKTETMQVPFQE